jgi:hypothetical protein
LTQVFVAAVLEGFEGTLDEVVGRVASPELRGDLAVLQTWINPLIVSIEHQWLRCDMLILGLVMSKAAIPSYLEIIEFIASGTTPQAVADYRPSPEAQQRIAELITREKEGGLSAEEKSELDHFMDLEHILRVAKARARQILSSGS